MQDIIKKLKALQKHVQATRTKLGMSNLQAEVDSITAKLSQQEIWDNPTEAAELSKKQADLEKQIKPWSELDGEVQETLDLAELNDSSLVDDITKNYKNLLARYKALELTLKLSGKFDHHNAIISIHVGTGGTDAQDWAQMLLRMYLRYCEQTGYKTEILEISPGEEAGIKSATVEVRGDLAYGKLKAEAGVHRLVRLSPFNANNLRQTSFALVEVLPMIDGPTEITLDPKDLKIDVYRSSGPGGQSVNTTDSAVRVTHLPTNLVVAIQSERSQLQNREKALIVLKSRLLSLMEEQHQAELSKIKGPNKLAAWGNQIRSYVLHPYNLVKDHRTGYETTKTDAVLDGDIEGFIDAYLHSQIEKAT